MTGGVDVVERPQRRRALGLRAAGGVDVVGDAARRRSPASGMARQNASGLVDAAVDVGRHPAHRSNPNSCSAGSSVGAGGAGGAADVGAGGATDGAGVGAGGAEGAGPTGGGTAVAAGVTAASGARTRAGRLACRSRPRSRPRPRARARARADDGTLRSPRLRAANGAFNSACVTARPRCRARSPGSCTDGASPSRPALAVRPAPARTGGAAPATASGTTGTTPPLGTSTGPPSSRVQATTSPTTATAATARPTLPHRTRPRMLGLGAHAGRFAPTSLSWPAAWPPSSRSTT